MRYAKNFIFIAVKLACLASMASCTGVSYKTVTNDDTADGFRYYDSSPYLLVQTDNKGGLTSDLKYLPDPTKKRSVRPWQFLSKNEAAFTFDNGILTSSEAVQDSTVIPKAVIGALEQMAKAAIKLSPYDQAAPAGPRVYLFKIVKENGKWCLLGAEGHRINV